MLTNNKTNSNDERKVNEVEENMNIQTEKIALSGLVTRNLKDKFFGFNAGVNKTLMDR